MDGFQGLSRSLQARLAAALSAAICPESIAIPEPPIPRDSRACMSAMRCPRADCSAPRMLACIIACSAGVNPRVSAWTRIISSARRCASIDDGSANVVPNWLAPPSTSPSYR